MTAFACLALIAGGFWLMIFIQYKISQWHSDLIRSIEARVAALEYLEQERGGWPMSYSASVSIRMLVGGLRGIEVAAVGGDSLILRDPVSLPIGEQATVVVTIDDRDSSFTGRISKQDGKVVWLESMLRHTTESGLLDD